MLDQNTDRMWFVIGALVVGAGIILLANKALPEIFANVTKSFETVTDNAIKDAAKLASAEENIVWKIRNSSLPNIGGYRNAVVEKTSNQTVESMNTNKAIRVKVTGGELVVKGVAAIVPTWDQVVGRRYVYDITAKNNGDKIVYLSNNMTESQSLYAGETKRLRFVAKATGNTHLQFQLNTKAVNDSIDVYLSDYSFGYYADDLE